MWVLLGALLGLGDAAAAAPLAREALEVSSAQPAYAWGVDACATLAQALVECGGAQDQKEVESVLAQGFIWLGESGAEVVRPRLVEARAALARATGDEGAHTRDLAEALRLYRALGLEGHARRLAS